MIGQKMNTNLTTQKYKRFITIGNVISALIAVMIIILPGNILSIPFAFIFYIIATKTISSVAANNIILPVLKQNTDPKAFSKILDELKIFTDNATEHIITSYLSGDYQNVLNICYAKLKDVSQQRYSHIYYTYIARCYFDIGDKVKLKETCEQFEQMTNSAKHGKEIVQKCTAIKFFKLFLEEDYAACKQLYEKIIAQKDFTNDLLSEVQTKYTYAVACFYTSDFQSATEIFEFIINRTPDLNYAVMSAEYLDCIKSNSPFTKNPIDIQVTPDFTIPKFTSKRQVIGKILIYTGLFISLAAVLIFTLTQTNMSFKLF